MQRLQEESTLLISEQRSVLCYYEDMVETLTREVESLDPLGSSPCVEAAVETETASSESRYWVSEVQLKSDKDVRSGRRALLARARAAAMARLHKAKANFS